MRLRPIATIAIAVCSALLVSAQAPPATSPQEQRPTFRTEANFVRVDVYPSAGGKAVTDLSRDDFEVMEDGKPQVIETFEHVTVRPAGPQATRVEPNTIAESRDMARSARARVIVLFFDVPHVTVQGSWTIREPLVRFLDRVLGADDLVGIMTPKMAASDLVLARKTDVIAGGLMDRWPWGERFTIEKDRRDYNYEECFPPTRTEMKEGKVVSDLAREMIERRRERATLESLSELVHYLRDLREERKAILTVTEGWLLFRPDSRLTDLRRDKDTGQQDPIPGVDPVTVGPDGRLTTKDPRRSGTNSSMMECERDRDMLAYMDDDQYMRDLMEDANRANATFYTVDPRGLAVFDMPIGPDRPPVGPDPPPPVSADAKLLRTRHEAMITLAVNTDGVAVMQSNDLDKGMQRIADDLTSYYLLGYYSSMAKLDGKFHAIKVRVERPGVEVRARRGYRAATAEEVARARPGAAAPAPNVGSTVAEAIGALSRLRPESRMHINALALVAEGSGAVARVLVAGELSAGAGWTTGGSADVEVTAAGTVESTRITLAPGQRSFLADVSLAPPVETASVDVRVQLSGPGVPQTTDRLTASVARGLSRPLLFRRGPSTANRVQPAATPIFSRTERLHLETPIATAWIPGAARLLDKVGQPLAIPVTVSERTDAAGAQRWLTADITLAPLAPGDYAIEVGVATPGGEQRSITAIRIIR